MKTIQELKLADLLPSSLLRDSNVRDVAESLDPELKLVTLSANEALILPRIDELDERIIDMLAWQYHVDFYELADSLKVKRELVKNSLSWHMKKGTKYAILKALEMLGIEAEYQNWYEFGGEPYTFRINAKVRPEYYEHSDHEKLIANIYRAVNDSKAARSYLAQLITRIEESDTLHLYHGIAQGLSGLHRILIDIPKVPELRMNVDIAQGLSGYRIMWPEGPELNHEMKVYQGVVMTLLSSFDIHVDYLQPELNYQDRIYYAYAENLSGQRKFDYAFDLPELNQALEIGLYQTETFNIKIQSEPYVYEMMLRDLWNYTGEPEKVIDSKIRVSAANILSGHVTIREYRESD